MPGVIITTSARSGLSSAEPSASGQAFIVGLAERGPVGEATLVRGLADYEAKFGGRTSYSHLWDTVKVFFDEGGSQAYISRVVGPTATAGKISISNTAETPAPLIEISGSSPGAWSGDVDVVVEDGVLPGAVNVVVLVGTQRVETFTNITDLDDLIRKVNSQSGYVTVTDLGAEDRTLPAPGTYSITAGTDDRASVLPAHHSDALDAFVDGLGDGAVLAPDTTAINQDIITHALANNRIALLYNENPTAGISEIGNLPNSDAAGMFFPWVQVADNAGNLRDIPPVGYVAGVRARAHAQVGAWRAPAGEIAVGRSVVGVTREFTRSEADLLDDARISVIRRISNSVRLYGWRSLSLDTQNFGYLNARDLLNHVVVESSKRLEQFVFAPVDGKGQLLSSVNSELVGILEPIRLDGGLYPLQNADGEEIDQGYLVDTSSAVNTLESLARNEVRARVSLRVSPIGALVLLDIVKVGLRSGL
jgi:phage tail sheath protein FI